MLRQILMRFLLSLCLASFTLAVQATTNDLSQAVEADPLAHLRPNHPRLLFTDEQLAAAMAAAKTDPLRADLNRHIIATAESILKAPPVRQPDAKAGQEQDRYAVYYILTCTMAYRLTGDERFFARAKSDLLTVAAFPDWDPRHFLSIGEMSFAVAIGYDWLYAKLTPDERATLRQALLDKSLCFTDTAYGYGPGPKGDWTGTVGGNWNMVCNNGLLSAALAIADEEPVLARKVIAGVRKTLPNGMASYAPDGGWPEGPGYWTYATTYAAVTFTELQTALGTDFGLPSATGFDHAIYYYEAVQGPFGPVFNYADATDDLQVSPARTWLAKKFNAPFALHDSRSLLADIFQRETVEPFDRVIQGTVINRLFALHEVWFPNEPSGSITDPPLDSHFRGGADIATFRSAWNDTNALFVGFKAGDTFDHHTHLDLGSFVLDAGGQRWALDFGMDYYSLPGYGDTRKGQRWTYLRLNNHGHNTVTPGDVLQYHRIVAPITKFGNTPDRGFAVADLTPAYSNDVVSLQRGIALLDRARVLVQDEYQPAPSGLPLHWLMATKAKIDIDGDGRSATLTSGGRTLRADLLEPAGAKFFIKSARPQTPAENQNDGAAFLAIDLNPVSNAASNNSATRLAVLLTPVGEKWPTLNPPELKPLAQW